MVAGHDLMAVEFVGMRSEFATERTEVSGDLEGRTPSGSRRGGIVRYIVARLGQGVFVLFGAVTVSFLLVHATGNPITVLAGTTLSPNEVHALAAKLGYNRPVLEQYGSYLWGALRGNFGTSFRYQTPAINSVLGALPYTLMLVGVSLVAAVLLSGAVAVLAALSERGWAERVWRPAVVIMQGVPDFWIALLLVLWLSVYLRLLPSLGFDGARSLIMPCIALTLPMLASFTRLLRARLFEFIGSPGAFALRTRGLSRRQIVLWHGIRNAMTTFVPYVALQTGWLIGGTLIVETIFAWPGLGTLLLNSVQARDLTVIQAIVVVIALCFTLLNLLADLLLLWIDPRIGRPSGDNAS